MATLTVTANSNGSNVHNGIGLAVRIFSGATEGGGNSASGTPAGSTGTISLTPAGSNSLIAGAWGSGLIAGAFSAATNNTDYFTVNDGTNTASMAWLHYSATVTSGSPVSVGATLSGSSTVTATAYELLSSTGSTPTLLTSPTPGEASGATSVTSGSATVTFGNVLVALITALSPSGTGVSSFTVADSMALTWTSRVFLSGANGSAAGIFTATVPPAPPPPTTVYQMRSS